MLTNYPRGQPKTLSFGETSTVFKSIVEPPRPPILFRVKTRLSTQAIPKVTELHMDVVKSVYANDDRSKLAKTKRTGNVRPEMLVCVNCRSKRTLRSRTSRGAMIGVKQTRNSKHQRNDVRLQDPKSRTRELAQRREQLLARLFPTRLVTKGTCGYSVSKERVWMDETR